MANQLIPWHSAGVPIWAPASNGTMVQIDIDAPLYVRVSDHEMRVKNLQFEIQNARTNEADARRSAMEVSQREARWMMIENRLKTALSDRCGYKSEGAPPCTCPRCLLASVLWNILNSDPPVGNGFQSFKGVEPNVVNATLGPVLGRRAGAEVQMDAPTGFDTRSEAKVQGDNFVVFPDLYVGYKVYRDDESDEVEKEI